MEQISAYFSQPIPIIIALINGAAFLIMGIDKLLAKCHARRIPERVLLGFCAVFGAAGGYAGMHLFRHKTRKFKFSFFVPVFLIIQIALIACYYYFNWGK